MKAASCSDYGSVENIKVIDTQKPVPKKNEVLIQVIATTVQSADWRIRTLSMPYGMGGMARLFFGLKKPRQPIFGTELSGKVTEVGSDVADFKVGDEVIAATGAKMGAHAEFVTIAHDKTIVKKPGNLNYQQSASLPFGGLTALDYLKYKAQVKNTDHVLVTGASGAVGTASVQIAKILGATVTTVCSQAHIELMKSLGADYCIDYTKQNYLENYAAYDVIIDIVGLADVSSLQKCLKPSGRLILVTASLPQMLKAPFQKVIAGVILENKSRLQELVNLATTGKYKAIVGKEFSLTEIQKAHLEVESRHKFGNIVVNM